MNWLITGGCGFIGRSLIKRLVSVEGTSVRVVDDLSVGSEADLRSVVNYQLVKPGDIGGFDSGVELVVGDVVDADLALRAAYGADVIIHLAANTGVGPSVANPRKDLMNNVLGVFNYLEAARESLTRRFIFASSGAPLGDVVPPIHEELAPHPVSPYGASKLCGEAYCSAYFRTFGVETVALRFGNVYGPGSSKKDSVVAKFVKKWMAGEGWEIFGDGRQTRDFIYIEDLVGAIVAAATVEGIGGEVFQIATSKETTVLELASTLNKIIKKRGGRPVEIQRAPERIGDVARNYSDTSKARDLLDWQSSTTLESGLDKTLEFFVEQGSDFDA